MPKSLQLFIFINHIWLFAALFLTPKITAQNLPDAAAPAKQYRKVVIRGEAEKQSAGRISLSGDQIKNAPATFGDALNALTTLPGVGRPDVLIGQLVIRGTGNESNRYFVDGIPIPRPQHFGGLHSVLNNDIIKEANIYASAFPVTFGNATGAVLEFQTIDDVNNFGAVIDVGLVSANALLKSNWPGGESRPDGYWIGAARIGYLPLIIPPVYEWMTGQTLIALPQYYDYQLKGKLNIGSDGTHSITWLALGSYDTVKVLRSPSSNESYFSSDLEFIRPGAVWTLSSHSAGFYYDYNPSRKLNNRLLLFNTLATDRGSYRSSAAGSSESVKNQPNLAGLKNTLSLTWLDGSARLTMGLEYSLYYFSSQRTTTFAASSQTGNTPPPEFIDDTTLHHVPSAFMENRFRFGGLRIVPGARGDYLHKSKSLSVGPRGLIGYDFSTGTTLELAGGIYQSFPQINIVHYGEASRYAGSLTNSGSLKPEEAVHRSLAVTQKYGLWNFKIEGYWNTFYRHLDYYSNASSGSEFITTYAALNQGIEFSLNKTVSGSESGDFFGWASYSLSRSVRYNALSQYDQTHNIKLVAGYLTGIHSISLRLDVYSGFPYIPVIGSEQVGINPDRYFPEYGSSYTEHFPVAHRISLRYSQERIRAWGSWRWYFEIINITNYSPLGDLLFDSRSPYQAGVNPTMTPREPRIPILPNFGVEIRF